MVLTPWRRRGQRPTHNRPIGQPPLDDLEPLPLKGAQDAHVGVHRVIQPALEPLLGRSVGVDGVGLDGRGPARGGVLDGGGDQPLSTRGRGVGGDVKRVMAHAGRAWRHRRAWHRRA